MMNLIHFNKACRMMVVGWFAAFVLTSAAEPAEDVLDGASVATFVGKTKIIRLSSPVTRVAIGDPDIADFKVVSPSEVYVLGKAVGTTSLMLWQKNGKTTTIDTTVGIDLAPLAKTLAKQLPNEKDIVLSSASGSVVLSGAISDSVAADVATSLAEAHVRNLNRYLTGGFRNGATSTVMPNAERAMVQVINLMKVRDPQQVMLEVRVAEISKKLLDRLGVGIGQSSGDVRWNVVSNFAPINGAQQLTGGLGLFQNSGTKLNIDAERSDTLVKILAEPNIVASSGQEGSFLAGGRIFIPVPQSANSNAVTLVEREYGVGLKFIPTVLDGGRINLKVSPEVSELSNVTITAGGTQYPTFTTRSVSTTVQLKNGEHLVIGGLMRNNISQNVKAFPVLGQLPILGVLFRSTEFISDKTELVIIVSPSLVKGTTTTPQAPTDQFVPPSRTDLFIGGKLEGNQ
ncbi:type II and III secretion system protein family protein [Candidatus Methylopumilus turicensis]|nr:type II and III secretion system protein family protein [Candidatus Methylopumilus turicensis]